MFTTAKAAPDWPGKMHHGYNHVVHDVELQDGVGDVASAEKRWPGVTAEQVRLAPLMRTLAWCSFKTAGASPNLLYHPWQRLRSRHVACHAFGQMAGYGSE